MTWKRWKQGVASVDDIRFYYCHQTDETKIAKIEAGTKSYGIVINIPAGQSRGRVYRRL